jgi:hypothetical protein
MMETTEIARVPGPSGNGISSTSPEWRAVEAFSTRPNRVTFPVAHISAARPRVLKNRAAQSHLSQRAVGGIADINHF